MLNNVTILESRTFRFFSPGPCAPTQMFSGELVSPNQMRGDNCPAVRDVHASERRRGLGDAVLIKLQFI